MVDLPVFSVDLHEAARRSETEASEWVPEQLDEAVERYRRFFYLASLGPGIAPTRDIDMIWHLHMQAPVAYYRDCMKYLGRVLDHDGGFGKTAERWQEVFGEPYVAAEQSGMKCWHDCQDRCWHACSEIAAEVPAGTAEA